MNRRALAAFLLLLMAASSLVSVADANFNAATGFSGRQGFTCTSCHNVPDMGPFGEEQIYDPPAKVTLTGLPEEWVLGESYELTITVQGGPPAAPSPAPQGGFEIEANEGVFRVPEGMEDFINVYHEDEQAVTYTAAGTQMREWRVTWIAPALPFDGSDSPEWWAGLDSLEGAPTDISFWVAAMSANGNHVVAAESSDGGELGDSVDNITLTVPPSQSALDAWNAMLLMPPVVESVSDLVEGDAFTIRGQHTDPLATHLGYRLNDGEWQTRSAPASKWNLEFSAGLPAGDHTLWVRSESEDRRSEPVRMDLHVDSLDDEGVQTTPFPSLLLVAGLLAAVSWRRLR